MSQQPPIPRDAPRCLRCGVRLPFHVAGCPVARDEPIDTTKPEIEPTGLDAVSRPPYEVTQRSKFNTEGHDDCDCMSCRPYTS